MNFLSTEAATAFIVNNQIAGRKFEVEDLTPALESAARTVALAWIAPSAGHWAINFMADMKVRAGSKKGLSIGQAKGVLNVVRAEAKPKVEAAAAPLAGANISKVRTARFRVVAPDGDSIALRISVPTMWTDAPKGTRKISARGADGWETVGKADPNGTVKLFNKIGPVKAGRVADALETLQNADDDLVYILAYAMEGSECGFCGLELDTVESLTVGYGPTCAKKHDLPWGAKAVPAKVLLAKEGLIAEAPEATAPAFSPKAIPAAPAAPSVADLKAALDAAKKAFALADGDDEDAAFEAVVAAKKALAAAVEAAASKADYDLQTDTDGAVITLPGIVLRPWGNDDADDLAAAADLANDMAAGN